MKEIHRIKPVYKSHTKKIVMHIAFNKRLSMNCSSFDAGTAHSTPTSACDLQESNYIKYKIVTILQVHTVEFEFKQRKNKYFLDVGYHYFDLWSAFLSTFSISHFKLCKIENLFFTTDTNMTKIIHSLHQQRTIKKKKNNIIKHTSFPFFILPFCFLLCFSIMLLEIQGKTWNINITLRVGKELAIFGNNLAQNILLVAIVVQLEGNAGTDSE